MGKDDITIGVIATRRDVFSASEAQKHKDITIKKLKSLGISIVDIDDINSEGLLFSEKDLPAVVKKMKRTGVDGVFFPHCNFGTKDLVAKAAAKVGKPVLLWGPRDDAPLEDGLRTRDTQCGLFATGKILRRFNVPFTYIENCRADDAVFAKGFKDFVLVCSVVKAFRGLRVLQVGPRPAGFWSVICNEGELLERFGIQVTPVSLIDIVMKTEGLLRDEPAEFYEAMEIIRGGMDCADVPTEILDKITALKVVLKELCFENGCTSIAIQCWNSLQDGLGIMPCTVNGLLMDEGIPVACETDIHGAVSAVLLQAAAGNHSPVFFADLTVRHPENDNAELLWHCGNFPPSIAREGCEKKLGKHFIFPGHEYGTGEWELMEGDITICRFDGDHGEYLLFAGEGRAVDGPKTKVTYVWFEVPDWPAWEKKLVEGPYIHHCAGVYGNYAGILAEACKYIPGLSIDLP